MCHNIIKCVNQGDLESLKLVYAQKNGPLLIKDCHHNKTGDNLLSYACRQGNVQVLEFLHSICKLDLEQGNFDGKRPLHDAAQYGNLDCVLYLLNCGTEVNIIKRADWTPLMLACTKTNLQIIKQLISSGADPSLENKDGWNSFHLACREGNISIVEYLHQTCKSIWNTVSKNGRTPLHTAALHGRKDVVSYLISHCSYNVDVKDSCGTTPFMDAIRANFSETADILFTQHMANIAETDNLNRHSLHLAAQSGSESSVYYLLDKHKVSVNIVSKSSGVSPLHLACKENHAEIIEILLQYGADVNQSDNRGRSALHIASGSQHIQCVDSLLKHGAYDHKDESGSYAKDLTKNENILQIFSKREYM